MQRKNISKLLCVVLVVMSLICVGCGTQKTPSNGAQQDAISSEETEEHAEVVGENKEEVTGGAVAEIEEEVTGEEVTETEEEATEEEVTETEEEATEGEVAETEEEVTEEDDAGEERKYPVMLDSDRLQLLATFEYTGINPDCGDAYGESIGAIQLKNVSGTYLEHAKISIKVPGNKTLVFNIENVPADTEVLAFEVENREFDDVKGIEEIQAEAKYAEKPEEEKFSYSVDGSEITVKNISGKKAKNITVYYHCSIDGLLYGGKSYELKVDALRVGESTTVTDSYCYLGDLVVVNIVV